MINKVIVSLLVSTPILAWAEKGDELIDSLKPVQRGIGSFGMWLYTILGLLALIYAILEIVRFWNGKITWMELMGSFLKIVVAAFVIVIVPHIWDLVKDQLPKK
ncbi:MAG: hypothetical protein WDW20_06140 [Neisseriaceae bacterium]